jgi:hypothetical protein
MTALEDIEFSVSGLILTFFILLWVIYPIVSEKYYLSNTSEISFALATVFIFITFENIQRMRLGGYGIGDLVSDLRMEMDLRVADWLLRVFGTLLLASLTIPLVLLVVSFLVIGITRVVGYYPFFWVDLGVWALLAQFLIIVSVRIWWKRKSASGQY